MGSGIHNGCGGWSLRSLLTRYYSGPKALLKLRITIASTAAGCGVELSLFTASGSATFRGRAAREHRQARTCPVLATVADLKRLLEEAHDACV